MTNIAAVVVPGQEGSIDSIAVIADSMSSTLNGEKRDSAQKLYKIGDKAVLTGMGYHHRMLEVALHLRNNEDKYESIEDMVKDILEITTIEEGIDPGVPYYKQVRPLNFILAGLDESGMHAFHINTTGVPGDIAGVGNYGGKKGYQPIRSHVLDGSGSAHASQAIRYKPLGQILDTADGIIAAYQLAQAGAIDSGVNDKLQIAVLKNQSLSTIYDRDVVFEDKWFDDYLSSTLRCEVPEQKERHEIVWDDSIKRSQFKSALDDFYDALNTDLQRHVLIRNSYMYASLDVPEGRVSKELFDGLTDQWSITKGYVKQGVDALLSDPESMLNYADNFATRRKDTRDIVRELISID